MGPGVVLLEHGPGSGHQRQDVWLHNVLNVLLGCQVALYSQQLAPACVVDGLGSGIAEWLESRTRDREVLILNPARVGNFISSEVIFVLTPIPTNWFAGVSLM